MGIGVLIVEDEFLLRADAVEFMEHSGFTVHEASNADEAIEVLELHHDIRAVFTDIHMPGTMDGLKLAHYVRGRWPPVKLIITSGYARPLFPWPLELTRFDGRVGAYSHSRLAVRSEATPINQLAFEGSEEALAHRVIVGVADRACRWTDAGLLAAIAESNRSVLRASVRMMDDVVGLPGRERHVESVEHDAGLQISREGPSDDPARPGVENDREVEKAGQRGQEGVSRPREFHLRPLAEPDVNLSAHPAPTIHPTTDSPSTNGRMRVAGVAPAV